MNRSGYYVDNLSGEARYKSFRPAPLPPEGGLEVTDRLMKLTADARAKLSELDAVSGLIPGAKLFISMYVRKEALISSQIEGTQCTLDDVLDPESETNANLDVSDVINYVSAALFALRRMKELPICSRLLRETHAVLLTNARGEEKKPGQFRRSQNWLGPAGCAIRDARYVPPNVSDMNECMSDLEKFINGSDEYDPLINAALIHYQFETIHPFLDGNGRIGRLLILLYIIERGLLAEPVLYISFFLKKNQVEYYDRMTEVRRTGNYEQWIMFFLEAVAAACADSLETVRSLSALHARNLELVSMPGRAGANSLRLFEYIEQHPIIDIGKTAKALNLSYNTVSSLVGKFGEKGILSRSGGLRNRTFKYAEYLDILRRDT